MYILYNGFIIIYCIIHRKLRNSLFCVLVELIGNVLIIYYTLSRRLIFKKIIIINK